MAIQELSWNTVFPHWPHRIRLPQSLSKYISTVSNDAAQRRFAEEIEASKKVELHVHLEAALPESFYASLNEVARLYESGNLPSERAPFPHLKQFISAWFDNTKLINDEALFESMAREFVKQRALQNIVYTEAHFSPLDFSFIRKRFGIPQPLDLEKIILNVLKGIQHAEKEYPGTVVRLIADCLWPSTDEERETILRVFERVVDSSDNKDRFGERILVAIGLGGPELSEQAEKIFPFVERCRELGLHVDIHSGENVSAKDHRHSVETLQPDRIGHGISGFQEEWFFSRHIGACPLSNILTGSFPDDFAKHPVRKMWDKGCSFSINSDDPLLFASTLSLEYVALRQAFGFGMDFFNETQKFARNAVFSKNALNRAFGM